MSPKIAFEIAILFAIQFAFQFAISLPFNLLFSSGIGTGSPRRKFSGNRFPRNPPDGSPSVIWLVRVIWAALEMRAELQFDMSL